MPPHDTPGSSKSVCCLYSKIAGERLFDSQPQSNTKWPDAI